MGAGQVINRHFIFCPCQRKVNEDYQWWLFRGAAAWLVTFVFAAGGLWNTSFSPVTKRCKDNKMFNPRITPPDANTLLATVGLCL
jgi:hypothetical protein